MSRMQMAATSPAGVARELAGLVCQSDAPRDLAALAHFGRFLVPDEEELAGLVSRLPPAARERWQAALEVPTCFGPAIDRDALLARIEREAAPVLAAGHFWELLLAALDRQHRRRRGIYFTPRPLVDFLVRSVRQALADQFEGAARVNWIDPACGYGAFLLAASDAGIGQRRSGLEVCPMTWAVANLLMVRHGGVGVELLQANPLLDGEALASAILGTAECPSLPAIVGNPPWSNFGRQNRSPWMNELLADYRAGLAERKSNLADDAIKFIRWGQFWIDRAGGGILALVTPNTWLDGLTHRRMRESLLASFDSISVVDLHGEADRSDDDENVFGVRSGVAVIVMVKRRQDNNTPHSVLGTQYSVLSTEQAARNIQRLDVTGPRLAKLASLNTLDPFPNSAGVVSPAVPAWSFAIHTSAPAGDYESFWPLNRIFRHYISGVQTKNDGVFVGFTPDEVARQVQAWLANTQSLAAFDAACIRPYLVAPFDRRWIYYDPRLIGRARYEVMRHMLRLNLALVFMRQSTAAGEYDQFLAVDSLVSDRVFYSRRGAPFLAPVWVGEGVQGSGFRVQEEDGGRRSEVGG